MATNSNPVVVTAIETAAEALGLPALLVDGLVDLFETIAHAPDVAAALARAKQNALADAEDSAAVEAADEIIRRTGKPLY